MIQVFLSDVHLGAFSEERNLQIESELINLIGYCESNRIQIHILGDFFDYWMEFPDYLPDVGRAVLNRFEEYNLSMGIKTTYITGNHDYWTVSHFEDIGFRVVHEFVEMKLGSKLIFLCHGDGLADSKFQLPRPLLHRLIRDPKFVTFYKSIFSAKTGVEIMKKFSAFNRDEAFIDTERLNRWSKFMLENFSYDIIISGHDHAPRKETYSAGSYLNTGAFYKYRTAIMYTKNKFRLVNWVDDKSEFEPLGNHY